MALIPGTRLGVYEVAALLGQGGMGEVYRARDTKLGREVAVKVLPDGFASDPDRLARLDRLAREAKLLAALNHPNIATIHGLEESGGTRFLVLELVEGVTLAERLLRGPVPVDEALQLALQIADALEAAHEKGVVHRDLKPANIKVTPEGRVKVLDFGLAKTAGLPSDDAVTETALATREGTILGTAAYMSPEQARGEAVDRRADIWAFGVVLYELLTGASLFGHKTTAETLAAVLGTEPDYSALPLETPAPVRTLIRRCLERSQRRRVQHMGDVRVEIEDALAAPAAEAVSGLPATRVPQIRRWRIAGAIVVLVVIVGVGGWFLGQNSASEPPSRSAWLSIPFFAPPAGQPFGLRDLAISPDGSLLAYASIGRLWIRRMDDQAPTAVVSGLSLDPFFSPDGEWVGWFANGLYKAPVRGGPPVALAQSSDRPAGATWGPEGAIVYATTEGLYQVSEEGGESRLLVNPNREENERLYAWPDYLPDGRSVLFTIVPENSIEGAQIAALDLETLDRKIVLTGGTGARYVPTGHLVYASGSTLRAVAFDLDRRETRGDSFSLAGIEVGTAVDNGAADFAISDSGTLVSLPSSSATPGDLGRPMRTLSWIDRQGNEEPLPVRPASYSYPRVSPGGTRVAVEFFTEGNRDIWMLDLDRLTLTQLTNGPTEDMLAVWAPDGERVFFASDRAGNFDIYSQTADGASGASLEFASPGFHAPQSFTPDGARLAVYEEFKDTGLVTLGQADRIEPLLYGEFDDRLVGISPDGNWIVYESDESGDRFEVFVRPFPNVEERREQVSIDGGRYPLWSPTGNEIFYVDLDGEMMAVPVTLSPQLTLGRPSGLFQSAVPPSTRSGRPYDVSPIDGRFLVTKRVAEGPVGATQVSVVLNFFESLERAASP